MIKEDLTHQVIFHLATALKLSEDAIVLHKLGGYQCDDKALNISQKMLDKLIPAMIFQLGSLTMEEAERHTFLRMVDPDLSDGITNLIKEARK